MVSESSSVIDSTQFETDRAQFLGRGRTPGNPEAITRSLTNSIGAVLDPIFSLRRRVTILPNERFQFALVTVVAGSREAVIALAERYAEFHTCARAFETAWTHSQLEMRRLHIRPATKISKEELIALQAAAQLVLVAARGTLRRQLAATRPVTVNPRLLLPGRQFREEPSAPLAFMELKYFNGLGGFTDDGKEFVIYLSPGRQTPLPWINIMANPKFGAFVSESGAEFVWGRNSQNDRLTPWFNDPISDPPGTAIYIRDDDIGVVWSPTSQPIREKDAYRARHGQGYTTFEHNSHAIEQRLLTFVPVDDSGGLPVRLQRLRLRNNSSRRRKLTVTSYATLVLGSDPEETGMHVVTKWDLQSQSLFARNSYNPEFSDCITFASSTPTTASLTG